ncbi:MAG: hypothetical protein NC453_26775 [Muribaculum sp.]|nr:hypothetical protein [Muribaculum sp.]
MIEFVRNNPYRVLGVYANDPEKKWVENSLELFVSLKRDNSFMFPTDWVDVLGPLNRTIHNVKDAAFFLEEPISRHIESLFWVHNRGRGSFYANLNEGGIDLEMGDALNAKLYSQSINNAIRAVVEGNLEKALNSYKTAFKYKRPVSEVLIIFFDRAINEFVKVSPNGNPFTYFYHIFGDDYRPEFEKALVSTTKSDKSHSEYQQAEAKQNEPKIENTTKNRASSRKALKMPKIDWNKIYTRFVKPWIQFNGWTVVTIILAIIVALLIAAIL